MVCVGTGADAATMPHSVPLLRRPSGPPARHDEDRLRPSRARWAHEAARAVLQARPDPEPACQADAVGHGWLQDNDEPIHRHPRGGP